MRRRVMASTREEANQRRQPYRPMSALRIPQTLHVGLLQMSAHADPVRNGERTLA